MAENADAVVAWAQGAFDRTLERLIAYLRIPAISCDPDHAADVARLAERIRVDLSELGMDNARILSVDGALPCVAAERMKAGPDRPTVLVYGHLDLQPVAGEPWDSPPHEAVQKGDRLYARGSADDMGGWVSHLAAIEAWLAEAGELPVNLKLLIEGEEEIGSPNLERYMDEFPDAFAADIMVLTDCENPSTDIPGLTVSLRGIVELDLSCEALRSDVHSGLWGNLVPDPGIALPLLIARLVDEDGRLKVGRVPVGDDFREKVKDNPLDEEVIRLGAKLVDGVDPLPARGRPLPEWSARQPALTVLSTTYPPPGQEKNAVRGRVSARLSLRIAPGQTADELIGAIEDVLLKDPPGGVSVRVERVGAAGDSWLYEPSGPAFDAADRAYRAAWGHPLMPVGVGGSIPFVALFGRRFGDLPLILNGVMDPETGAHGPNESMHLSVFRKAIAANVHLYAELGALGSNR